MNPIIKASLNLISASSGNTISVTNADAVTIYLSASTDYATAAFEEMAKAQVDKVAARSFELIKRDHIRDYRTYLNRVTLGLGNSQAGHLPTDERLKNLTDLRQAFKKTMSKL